MPNKKTRWIGMLPVIGLMAILSLSLACGGKAAVSQPQTPSSTKATVTSPTPEVTPTKESTATPTPALDSGEIIVLFTGINPPRIEPSVIEVRLGKEYVLTFVSEDYYLLTIKGLGFDFSRQFDPGDTYTVTILTDQPVVGEYEMEIFSTRGGKVAKGVIVRSP